MATRKTQVSEQETAPETPAELAVISEGQQIPDYMPAGSVDTDWASLVESADAVVGADLAKDELLDALVNVPFLITKVVFRRGFRNRASGMQMAYVSCEAIIAPENVLRKRRVNLDTLPFAPGASVAFNDGSTGIYRQIVQYLSARNFVTLPDPITENGSYGNSSYDLPPAEWQSVNNGEISFDDEGFTNYECNVRLYCPRGLRLSEYENDYAPDGAKTRYLG